MVVVPGKAVLNSSPNATLRLYLLLKILLAQVNKDQIGCKATVELSVALIRVAFPGESLFVDTAAFIFHSPSGNNASFDVRFVSVYCFSSVCAKRILFVLQESTAQSLS